jgi:hypothetical protein
MSVSIIGHSMCVQVTGIGHVSVMRLAFTWLNLD